MWPTDGFFDTLHSDGGGERRRHIQRTEQQRLPAAQPPARPDKIDGESIVSLLKGATRLKRDTLYWHYPHYHPGSATPYNAIRQGDWKLIHFFEDDHVELYNLKDDLGEKNDLAASNPAKASALKGNLAAWTGSVGAQLPEKNPNFDPNRTWDSERPAERNGARPKKK